MSNLPAYECLPFASLFVYERGKKKNPKEPYEGAPKGLA